MNDNIQTKEQMVAENEELRRRIAAMEGVELQRKHVEEELTKSKAILSAAIECLPFDVFALNREGRCILQNAVSRQYYGDALGKTTEEVCPDQQILARWLEKHRRALAGEQVEGDVELTIEGEQRQLHNIITPIRNGGNVLGFLGVNVDITDRVRAEAAVRESEERYRSLAEASPDVIYILDKSGNLLYANRTAAAYIGVSPESLVGKTQFDLFPPDRATYHMERIKRVFQTGEAGETEELYRFGGQEVWLNVRSIPIRNEQGQVTSVMGVCRNITARKRAEQALQKAHAELEEKVEERTTELAEANEKLDIFRRFAEASGQGFSMADLDGHLTYLNPALCRILGVQRPEDLIGQHFSVCYPEKSQCRGQQEIMPCLIRDGQWQGELPMLSSLGKVIPTWHNTFVIRDENGNPICLAVVITDMTERKQTEEVLRQNERRFRNYFEQSLIGMAATTRDGHWIEVNDRICEVFGYQREELFKKPWAELTHPEDLPKDIEQYGRLLAGEIDHYTLDKRFIRQDGSILYTTINIRAIRRDDGSIDHIFGLMEDITERERAVEALQRERRTLEHMLRASDHERQLIAYDIHDGLAQQLAGAIMYFQNYSHLQSTDRREAAKVFDAGMTMLRQSHGEARRLISGVRPPILDESGVVAAVAHLVYDPAFDQGPKIFFRSKVAFQRLAPVVENVIYRITQEGLSNARNHSKSKRIVVSLLQRNNRLRIKIRDWGVGFDPKIIHENRFGLNGIRERARLLGGKCRIKSEPGRGTLIVVELPVVEQVKEG